MTRLQAHAVLDAAKAGFPVTQKEIEVALMATGDLVPELRFYAPDPAKLKRELDRIREGAR